MTQPRQRPQVEQEYFSLDDFATLFGVSRETVRMWARERLIASLEVLAGGRLLIPASEADRLRSLATQPVNAY